LRTHATDAMARGVDVRDEYERNGNYNRKDHKQFGSGLGS
jgi:hypothetical protein